MRWSGKSFASALIVMHAGVRHGRGRARRRHAPNPPAGMRRSDRAGQGAPPATRRAAAPTDLVARGRYLVISHACGVCHGGGDDPAAKGWLAGSHGTGDGLQDRTAAVRHRPEGHRLLHHTAAQSDAGQCDRDGAFHGAPVVQRVALRASSRGHAGRHHHVETPGKGNFPMRPHYLAPPMPWPAWRHMPDADLRAIAAYLKRGLKPVVNKVADSEGPPDFWASMMIPENIGTYPAAAFPTANEQQPPAKRSRARAARTRARHRTRLRRLSSGTSPAGKGWLAGITSPDAGVRDRPVLPGSRRRRVSTAGPRT